MKKSCSPFWHYSSIYDAEALVSKFEDLERRPVPDSVVNYLGVVINPRFLPEVLGACAGTVEDPPAPNNWHSEIAEFAAVLRAVDQAVGTFTVIELGCGWGCWLVNSGAAARRKGLRVKLIGVEGDPDHVEFAKECLKTNRFDESQYRVFHGVASGKSGFLYFPKQNQGGVDWGLSPVEDLDGKDESSFIKLKTYPLGSLLDDADTVDLVHIDIQGGEYDFLLNCLEEFRSRVRWLMIGTHSREIEGKIFHLLLSNNFQLEIERPAILDLNSGQPIVVVDVVQGWRNRNLVPACAVGEALPFDSVKLLFDKGWSDPERNWRWSIGKESALRFSLGANEGLSGNMHISCDTLGEQDISASLNSKSLGSFRLNGANLEMNLRFDPAWIEKVNTLTLVYSNPRQPSCEDKRELAFCFKKLVVG